MYPYDLFFGITLYDVMITVGIIACFLVVRLLGDRKKWQAKLQNFILMDALLSIFVGYPVSVVTQAFYNIKTVGKFVINAGTGATFLGGLIGGAGTFLLIYFLVGRKYLPDGMTRRMAIPMTDVAACAIVIAHAFGRLGCLSAGCCGGRPTQAWYGITMASGVKIVPIQLFESLFLFGLFAVLFSLAWYGKGKIMPIYMFSYGVWRFLIEYARGDERGDTIVSFLSPSQLTSLLLLAGGIILLLIEIRLEKKGSGICGEN